MNLEDLLWFTRALRPSPFALVPERQSEESFEWIKRPAEGLLEGDVYTDGSLMDNEPALGGRCRALGWAFVILGLDGGVVAAARGCPPAWIDTIYGAELWAVQMVVIRMLPGAARVITDCASVKIGCEQGQKWTTAPGRVYARVWAVVHATGDDGDLSTPVVWMPAHTSQWQVGEAFKSDGTTLSDKDREANDLVDRFAKVAAAGRRVRERIRAAILKSASQVTDMAKWVAAVTMQANHYKLADGSHIRDSEADRAGKRKRAGHKRPCGDAGDTALLMAERLFKMPRLAALRQRVLARAQLPSREASDGDPSPPGNGGEV